jgi:hypothetical protein
MKKYLLSVLAISTFSFAFCQVNLEPNPSSVSDFPQDQADVAAYATFTNEAESEKTFTWTLQEVEVTEGWETALCDVNLCYLPTVSSETFTLGAGESGAMDVHVYPNNIEGSAIIEVLIVEDADTSNEITGLYLFNQTSSVPERLSENIKVYPNPAVNEIRIDEPQKVQRIEIFDIQGKTVKNVQTNGNGIVDVSTIPSGNYILRLYDRENEQVSSNLMMKE